MVALLIEEITNQTDSQPIKSNQMLVLVRGEESLRAEWRTYKLNPHMTTLEIKPWPHWRKESALTIPPNLLSNNINQCKINT